MRGAPKSGGSGRRARRLAAAAAGVFLLQASAAQAQPARARPTAAAVSEIEGTVLALQDEEIVLDLGASTGAASGSLVEIWRPIKLKHPVTGKVVVDRFRFGTLELLQVRSTMALAKPSGTLARTAQVGDMVILAAPVRPPAPAEPPSAGKPGEPAVAIPPEDLEAAEIGAMFDGLRGSDLATRIRRYEEHVAAHPQGRFAQVLFEEAASLRRLLAREQAQKKRADDRPAARSFARPEGAVAGAALRLAVELNDSTTGAVLHVRKAGAPAYVSQPMLAVGPGYFAAVVPGERVVAPGVELFIEGTGPSGITLAVIGSSADPEKVEVSEPPRAAASPKRMGSFDVLTDYADYNRLLGNDKAWQTEGTFGVRYGDTGIRALRLGFGVYRGVGGSVDELDTLGLRGRKVGLTYGYLETEVGLVSAFSLIGRLAVGLVDDGVSGGGQLLLRIGNDLRTNLLVGGELLGGVGLRSIVQLELKTFERFPIVIRTEVTNQPAGASPKSPEPGTSTGGGDVGGRGIVQVGYKLLPSLVISARGSFQGRTIKHAGPGLGGALGYTW